MDWETRGDLLGAYETYSEIAANYSGWTKSAGAAERARQLLARADVRDARERNRRLGSEHADLKAAAQLELARIRLAREQLRENDVARRIGLLRAQEHLARADSLEAPWLRRLLASMHVQLGFYEPLD